MSNQTTVLQSIYGDDAIQLFPNHADQTITRYEVVLSLPSPHEEVSIRVLVSLPENYPAATPPQLQLLSRYIGAFGADAALFGEVLRTFISSASGVEWAPGAVCVFDGLQSVLDRCTAWYGDRLSADAAGDLFRADMHPERVVTPPASQSVSAPRTDPADMEAPPIPEGIKIFVAEPITDRKSAFVGRACVPIILAHLLSDRRIARAAHPVINAWRCQVGSLLHQETAAGGRLAHLLHILEVDNVLVVDRFKHINQAARNALELGGFLDAPTKSIARGRHR
ncbi:hypothetical protein B0H11DRAFT_2153624 [Mycena galericulata]|nr:hypothetical protein B0H11DRAFT_2153624 [Mycena galericulata]